MIGLSCDGIEADDLRLASRPTRPDPPSMQRPPTARRRLALLVVAATGFACHATKPADPSPSSRWSYTPDLPPTRAPYREVHANYKERLEQRYVYVDVLGSYVQTGRALAPLAERMRVAGLEPSGPPFGLYFDDPGKVAVAELRSRACFPVDRAPGATSGLDADVLPRAHVVYAVVAGAYPEVPRAYPGLYAYMERMGWVEAGPIREIYLVAPATVASPDELLCEVQIPSATRP